jgi:hypothetical protein
MHEVDDFLRCHTDDGTRPVDRSIEGYVSGPSEAKAMVIIGNLPPGIVRSGRFGCPYHLSPDFGVALSGQLSNLSELLAELNV